MVDSDQLLAQEYASRGFPEKAILRLNNAIALNTVLLERDKTQVRFRISHANIHTRRAELSEQIGRHEQAVRDYRLAIEYSTQQSHREYCSTRVVQALVRKGDHRQATELAKKLDPDLLSHPLPCLELARGWLLIAGAGGNAQNVPPKAGEPAAKAALQNARKALLTAQNKGLFHDPQQFQKFHAQKDFEPLWDLIPRQPE
jgi:tetratricopeptide (TPR) repeat protein